MKGTIVSLVIKFIVGLVAIVLIAAIPSMFLDGIHISWSVYWDALVKIVHSLSHAADMTFHIKRFNHVREYNIFPTFWGDYRYSLIIFFSAFLIALIIGFFLTYLTVLCSKKVIRRIGLVLSFLESVPDLFIICCLQFAVIIFFNKTGILLVNIAGAFDKVYLLPIVTLSILPMILLFRILLLAVVNEENELYVDLARTKGLTKSKIILVHIYRNAIITLGSHIRSILFIMFSNLVMIEYIFNIYGFIFYILNHIQLDILTLGILLIYIPIYFLMAVIQLYSEHLTGEKVAV